MRGHLSSKLPMERRRQIAADATGFDPDLANALCEQGVSGLLVPEAYGGVGLGAVAAAVVAEALGYNAAPFGFTGAAVMAPLAIMHAGDDILRTEMLPAIVAGDRRVAVGWSALAGTTAVTDIEYSGRRLYGHATGLLDIGGATDILLALGDGRMLLIAADDPNIDIKLQATIDRTRPLGEVSFDGAAARLLDSAADLMATSQCVLDAGRLMIAADSLGAAQRMIDDALAYVCEREQFGRKIGGFQSIKHMFAEMVSMLEPCRSLVWYAAFAQQALPEEARLMACHAKAHLGETTREIARLATEAHGGIGFTDLLGLHFWFKRITFDRQTLGAPERCRADAARAQGWLAA